jgi:hypothetical protein
LNLVTLYLIPLAIVVLAVYLLVRHVRQWRVEQVSDASADERRYLRGRYRRRMQSSAMLLLAGLAMHAGQRIDWQRQPTLYVFLWCGVALVVSWVIVLALVDIVATRLHLARLERQRVVEKAKLTAELARARARETDGKG